MERLCKPRVAHTKDHNNRYRNIKSWNQELEEEKHDALHIGELNVDYLAGMDLQRSHDVKYDKIGSNWKALNGVKQEMEKALEDTSIDTEIHKNAQDLSLDDDSKNMDLEGSTFMKKPDSSLYKPTNHTMSGLAISDKRGKLGKSQEFLHGKMQRQKKSNVKFSELSDDLSQNET